MISALNAAAPNYDPPARSFQIFGFDIYYYAVCIVVGILVATGVVALLFKRRNIPVDWTIDLLLCILPLGIIGARTFYVVTDPSTSIAEWFTGFRDGGLSIIGGVIGGALGVVLFCLIHKINFLRVADCLLPGVILAQGLGRWGNFFNQEVYGPLITDEALQWFPFGVYIERVGEWHYAFFFYESLLNILIFALLFALMWNCKKKPHGLAVAGYFFGYGTVRSIMEPLRDPSYILGSHVPISQVFALIMAVGGVLLFLGILLWNRKKYGRCFGAAPGLGEPLAILPAYYTKEQKKKMEEANKLRVAAAKAAEEAANPAAGTGDAGPAAGQPAAKGEESKPAKRVLECPACGARFVAEENVAYCPFCHSPVQGGATDGPEKDR